MKDKELTALLAGRRTMPVEGGRTLRLLSAAQVLEARREAEQLAAGDEERAVCSNACLLARALEKDGRPVFASGEEVLRRLRVEEIAALAGTWYRFNSEENPSAEDGEERLERLKKAWSTRLMSALSGACSRHLGCSPRPPRRGR